MLAAPFDTDESAELRKRRPQPLRNTRRAGGEG